MKRIMVYDLRGPKLYTTQPRVYRRPQATVSQCIHIRCKSLGEHEPTVIFPFQKYLEDDGMLFGIGSQSFYKEGCFVLLAPDNTVVYVVYFCTKMRNVRLVL